MKLSAVLWLTLAVLSVTAVSSRRRPQDPAERAWVERAAEENRQIELRGGRLDAELFRDSILAVDAEIYADEPGRDGAASDRLPSALLGLYEQTRAKLGLRPKGQQTSRIFRFMARVGSHADVGPSHSRRTTLRREWEQLRAEVFSPADWFQRDQAPPARAPAATAELSDPEPQP